MSAQRSDEPLRGQVAPRRGVCCFVNPERDRAQLTGVVRELDKHPWMNPADGEQIARFVDVRDLTTSMRIVVKALWFDPASDLTCEVDGLTFVAWSDVLALEFEVVRS